MSTNHTPNCALSLWEASDQVLRTEFNENHAKIDAILGEAHDRAGLKLIREAVLETPVKKFELSLEGIDWNSIGIAVVDFYPVLSVSGDVKMYLNAREIDYFRAFQDTSVSPFRSAQLFLTPMFDGERRTAYATMGAHLGSRDEFITQYRQLNSASLEPDDTNTLMTLGTKIRLYALL